MKVGDKVKIVDVHPKDSWGNLEDRDIVIGLTGVITRLDSKEYVPGWSAHEIQWTSGPFKGLFMEFYAVKFELISEGEKTNEASEA